MNCAIFNDFTILMLYFQDELNNKTANLKIRRCFMYITEQIKISPTKADIAFCKVKYHCTVNKVTVQYWSWWRESNT